MLSNKAKFVIATVVAIIALTPIVVSLFKTKPAPAGAPETPRVVSPVTGAPAFVDDPAVLGAWRSVDFVQKIEDFVPEKQAWTGDLYLKGMQFMPNGATSGPWQWSKGTLWHPGDQTLAKYTIKTINGAQFLFMEWMSGDVTIRGEKPRYYVMTQGEYGVAAQPKSDAPPAAEAAAFVDDPSVLGAWVSVDFVQTIEDFAPGKKVWAGDLYLKGLQFMPNGQTSGPWQWNKGTLWHPGDRTLAKYTIKTIDGAQFLFMEWMSGDVTIRGEKPRYYVMQKS